MDSANKNRVRGHKDCDDDDWIQNTVGNLIGSSGDTVGLTRFYWILSSNPAILVEISTRITEFSERIQ